MNCARYIYHDFETPYIIYDNGRILNERTNKFLNPYQNNGGYLNVGLSMKHPIEGQLSVRKAVHRLVAEMFIPNPENKPTVNHLDGNKHNNDVSNLEWATYSEQVRHAHAHNLMHMRHGEDVHFSRYTEAQVIQACEMLSVGYSPLQVEKHTGIPAKTLYDIRKKNIWKHIACKYEFPKYKYPRSELYDPEFRDKAEEYFMNGCSIKEVRHLLNISKDDAHTIKMLHDWKYRLNKVQRLASNGVDAQANGAVDG